jgi:hypothetical protein
MGSLALYREIAVRRRQLILIALVAAAAVALPVAYSRHRPPFHAHYMRHNP